MPEYEVLVADVSMRVDSLVHSETSVPERPFLTKEVLMDESPGRSAVVTLIWCSDWVASRAQ